MINILQSMWKGNHLFHVKRWLPIIDPWWKGGGVGRSSINMERIDSQHFTAHMNCLLLIVDPGGGGPGISVWSTALPLVGKNKKSTVKPKSYTYLNDGNLRKLRYIWNRGTFGVRMEAGKVQINFTKITGLLASRIYTGRSTVMYIFSNLSFGLLKWKNKRWETLSRIFISSFLFAKYSAKVSVKIVFWFSFQWQFFGTIYIGNDYVYFATYGLNDDADSNGQNHWNT